MPSSEQLQGLWNLSDTVLYPEAVAFIQRLINEQGCATLPASQVTGLLNMANAATYSELERFIQHQRERNWPESKKDIKTFYTELERWFAAVKNRRLKDEFHLVGQLVIKLQTERKSARLRRKSQRGESQPWEDQSKRAGGP
jgi:hypothetical protein